jgi:antitoxin HigA-1
MKKLPNVHPGEILLEEFLKPYNISVVKLCNDIGVSEGRMSKIVRGERRITADTALRLSQYFNTSAKFWMGLQDDFDLEEEKNSKQKEFNRIKRLDVHAA